jgi:hypothetical protein
MPPRNLHERWCSSQPPTAIGLSYERNASDGALSSRSDLSDSDDKDGQVARIADKHRGGAP